MNKTFATLKNYIRPDDYMNSVKAFFVMQDTYKEFPDDDKFEGAFVNRDIYNMRARNYIIITVIVKYVIFINFISYFLLASNSFFFSASESAE